jgi:two-component system sensor histidine kinase BarA
VKGWLNKLNISSRILVSAILPLIVVTGALGYYMTIAHLNDIEREFIHRGDMLAYYLASYSEFGVFADNRTQLESDAIKLMREPDVVGVAIFNADEKLLVDLERPITGSITDHRSIMNDAAIFSAAIMPSQVMITDFPIPDYGDIRDSNADKSLGRVEVRLSKASAIARQHEILWNSALLLIVGILASILLSFAISRTVTAPLGSIVKTVRRLHDGELGSRVPITSGGELTQLAGNINEMAATIQNSQSRLNTEVDKATSDLQKVVCALEEKNRELDTAREAALEAGKIKSEFLASMSHEIRTPLSGVIGYSQLLEKMEQTEEQHEYTRTITQAASQLLVIIDDILRFTRLDSGKPELDLSLITLHERFENILSIQATAAYDKQLELVLLVHSDVPVQIFSDANRIGQVLTNLVTNAIKFTEQGHVVIEVSLKISSDDGDIIEVAVTDTGIGMSSDEVGHIFEPFTQADTSTSKIYGGTGLGLSISKRLVELIGGNIGVTSEPGKGSRFWFTIPTTHIETDNFLTERPLSGTRILLYERNTFSRRALRNRLLGWGVSVFNSGLWAEMLGMLDVARREGNPYDLLVLGLSVQEYGRRLVTEILEDIRHSDDIPILLLIGSEAQQLSSGDMNLNRVKLISKPPRSDRMLRAIQELLHTGDAAEPASTATRPPNINAVHGKLAGLKVLVAEDNEFNQGLIRHLLEDLGVSVTLAANGQQACDCAADTLFDLIFMDIHMPEVSGTEASNTIRAGKNRDTPIIALSADVFACEEQLDNGSMQACITKPVTGHKLADILHTWAVPGLDGKDAAHRLVTDAVNSLPTVMQQRLHAELAAQLASLRAACQASDHAEIQNHMHQLKGLTDYFQLAEFRAGYDSLHQAAADGDQLTIIATLDKLDAILASSTE